MVSGVSIETLHKPSRTQARVVRKTGVIDFMGPPNNYL